MGCPGVAILGLTMGLLFGRVLLGLLRARAPYVRGLLVGGSGSLCMIALHSVTDFPLRSPAISATLAVIAALLYRCATLDTVPRASDASGEQPHASRRSRGESYERLPGSLQQGMLGIIFMALLWGCAADYALDPLRAQLEERRVRQAMDQLTPQTREVADFVEASEKEIQSCAPLDARMYARLSTLAGAAGAILPGPRRRLRLYDQSLALCRTAARLEPLNAEHRRRIARAYAGLGRFDLAWQNAQIACLLRPNDPWIHARLARDFAACGHPGLAEHYCQRAHGMLAARRAREQSEESLADMKRVVEEACEAVAAARGGR